MGIRVGLTLFSVVALMIILGTTQTAYAGSLIMVTVEKTTTSGDGIFTFDLANPNAHTLLFSKYFILVSWTL